MVLFIYYYKMTGMLYTCVFIVYSSCVLWYSNFLIFHQLRDAKIRFLSELKRDSDEERSAWNELAASLKVTFLFIFCLFMLFLFNIF